MALSNIPVNMQGYMLMITEAPTLKMRENESGEQVPATDPRTGAQRYVVSLFAKKNVQQGEYPEKGEEIKVTLAADPGDDFQVGSHVQLINATISPWQSERNGRFSSGIAFRAEALSPVA